MQYCNSINSEAGIAADRTWQERRRLVVYPEIRLVQECIGSPCKPE